jgi:hypothetical protein
MNVRSVIHYLDWKSLPDVGVETIEEFACEFGSMETLEYNDGAWQDAGAIAIFNPLQMDFDEPFGKQYCIPMFLEDEEHSGYCAKYFVAPRLFFQHHKNVLANRRKQLYQRR